MTILRNTISGLLAAAGLCCLCVDIDCMAASPIETMAVLILGAALFGAGLILAAKGGTPHDA